MGIFAKRQTEEEPGGGGAGLSMELDDLFCPTCRRRMLPWEATCPDDGAQAVRVTELGSRLAPPPAHLLEGGGTAEVGDNGPPAG
jgi:hypothetical protein